MDNWAYVKSLSQIIKILVLTQAIVSWEAATQAILERENLITKLEDFERTASDPNRFFEKGLFRLRPSLLSRVVDYPFLTPHPPHDYLFFGQGARIGLYSMLCTEDLDAAVIDSCFLVQVTRAPRLQD